MITSFKEIWRNIWQVLVAGGENSCSFLEPEMIEDCVVVQAKFVDKLDEVAKRVDDVMCIRRLYLNPELTLETLAQEIGTNRTYLSRMFNQKKRVSYISYLNRLRLDYALSLLESGLEDMSQIIVVWMENSLLGFVTH